MSEQTATLLEIWAVIALVCALGWGFFVEAGRGGQ